MADERDPVAPTSCILCQIVAGEVRLRLEHEDDLCVVAPEIVQKAPLHLVVIPRRHIPSLLETSEADAALVGHLLLVAAGFVRRNPHRSGPWRLVVGDSPLRHLHVAAIAGRESG